MLFQNRAYILLLVLMLSIVAFGERRDIHILSVNDMHSNINAFPQLAALIDSLRTEDPNLLVFSAGDNRTGNPLSDMYEIPAYPMVALMNQVGFNASALGNHDFDVHSLPRLIGLSNFKYICANIFADDTTGIRTLPCQFFDAGGVKVGVVGAVQIDKRGHPTTHPDNLRGVRFEDPIQVVGRYEWLSRECDVTILISHTGYNEDVQMAEAYPWLDLIIGGHSHVQLTADEPLHNGVLITHNRSLLRQVTHITLTVDSGRVTNKRAEYIDLRKITRKNKLVQEMVGFFSNNPALQRSIARAEAPFSSLDELGCMVCDAFLDGTGADISIENRRGIRADSLAAGDITVLDVLHIDPFGNQAVILTLTGEELNQLLLSYSRMSTNRFPHLGGLHAQLTIDPSDSVTIRKIKLTTPDGRNLNPKKTYRVATNSYVLSGSKIEMKDVFYTNQETSDLIIKFLEKQKSVNYQGIRRITYK